jgi:hypothetical protein
MPRVDLPGGHHAIIRDPADVRRGDVRAVAAAADKDLSVSGNTQQLQAAGMMLGTATMQDVVVHRFLRSWTLLMKDVDPDRAEDERPAPITLEVIQDLPLRFYNAIAKPLIPALTEIQGMGGQESNGEPDPLSVARLSQSASTD